MLSVGYVKYFKKICGEVLVKLPAPKGRSRRYLWGKSFHDQLKDDIIKWQKDHHSKLTP